MSATKERFFFRFFRKILGSLDKCHVTGIETAAESAYLCDYKFVYSIKSVLFVSLWVSFYYQKELMLGSSHKIYNFCPYIKHN